MRYFYAHDEVLAEQLSGATPRAATVAEIERELLAMYVFFFQAEDGIRDGRVTGVQTCALPICEASRWPIAVGIPSSVETRGSRIEFASHRPSSVKVEMRARPSRACRTGRRLTTSSAAATPSPSGMAHSPASCTGTSAHAQPGSGYAAPYASRAGSRYTTIRVEVRRKASASLRRNT